MCIEAFQCGAFKRDSTRNVFTRPLGLRIPGLLLITADSRSGTPSAGFGSSNTPSPPPCESCSLHQQTSNTKTGRASLSFVRKKEHTTIDCSFSWPMIKNSKANPPGISSQKMDNPLARPAVVAWRSRAWGHSWWIRSCATENLEWGTIFSTRIRRNSDSLDFGARSLWCFRCLLRQLLPWLRASAGSCSEDRETDSAAGNSSAPVHSGAFLQSLL